jgi:hypothetical protein
MLAAAWGFGTGAGLGIGPMSQSMGRLPRLSGRSRWVAPGWPSCGRFRADPLARALSSLHTVFAREVP